MRRPATMFDRKVALTRLADETFDVVVVGGGITGAGVALDAASRGLSTALVERGDFASGTSSKSSKLVHGGLRYLQQKEFRLVHESLVERRLLLQNAPHLVEQQTFLVPLFGKGGVVDKAVARTYATALWMYDLAGGWRIGKRHRRITAEELSRPLSHAPDRPPRRRLPLLRRSDRRRPTDAGDPAHSCARACGGGGQLRAGDRLPPRRARTRERRTRGAGGRATLGGLAFRALRLPTRPPARSRSTPRSS